MTISKLKENIIVVEASIRKVEDYEDTDKRLKDKNRTNFAFSCVPILLLYVVFYKVINTIKLINKKEKNYCFLVTISYNSNYTIFHSFTQKFNKS